MTTKYDAAKAHFAQHDRSKDINEGGTVWSGEIENCDVCSRPMSSETYMIDGPVQASSRPMWGNLCIVCAHKSSPTIGWGKAQLYKRQEHQWRLIAGGPPESDDLDF